MGQNVLTPKSDGKNFSHFTVRIRSCGEPDSVKLNLASTTSKPKWSLSAGKSTSDFKLRPKKSKEQKVCFVGSLVRGFLDCGGTWMKQRLHLIATSVLAYSRPILTFRNSRPITKKRPDCGGLACKNCMQSSSKIFHRWPTKLSH